MEKIIGIVAAVVCGLLISNVAGVKLKFKEQDGYVYKQEQKSPFEVDVKLTINEESKGETVIYLNETHIRPYVVQIPENPTYCHIIFPNTALSKEERHTCSETKRLENFDRFPDEVEKKCEGRTPLLIRERKCQGEDAKHQRILKRSCYYGSEYYTFSSSSSYSLSAYYYGSFNYYYFYLDEDLSVFETIYFEYYDCYI